MLTPKEINEIKTLLENSNNPLYLFDDDGDGLCAYLLLKKHFKKGKGIPIKTAGPLDTKYSIYFYEENSDLLVILDKALVKQELIDDINSKVIYLDHHPLQQLKKVNYYNPLLKNKKAYIPTSHMAYEVVKTNLWIATVGCLFDYHSPEFLKEFTKEYPDLLKKPESDSGYILFETKLGQLVKLFAFNMKGKINEVKKSIDFLEKIDSPYEILNQTTDNGAYLYKRYEKLNKDYEELLNKAKKIADKENVLVFEYPSTPVSFTQYLSTELSYLYKDKTIIVAREKEIDMKISLRNQKKNIAKILAKALEGLRGHGGGHEHACGASVDRRDYNEFLLRIKNLTK